jgi:hypothetical protein
MYKLTENSFLLIITLVFSFFGHQTNAQHGGEHNLAAWGSAGFYNLNTDNSTIPSSGSAGLGGGLGYEFHKNIFIFQIGGEFQLGNSSMNIKDFSYDIDLFDTEGDEYIGHYSFTSNTDHYRMGTVNIPIMFGLHLGQKAYFLAGGKVGINAFAQSVTTSNVESSGTYYNLIDDFENMPNHYFGKKEEITSFDVLFKTNFSLSAEVGIYLSQPNRKSFARNLRTAYRLSFFVDYGLVNLHDNSMAGPLIINKLGDIGYQPAKNSFVLTKDFNIQTIKNFYAGLKFTFLVGRESKYDCNCVWP